MTEPELLASGPERRLPPAVRNAVPWVLALAVVVAVLGIAIERSGHGAARPRTAAPVSAPATFPSTAPVTSAAPIAADLARVLIDPARHRLRLIFTVFNAQMSRVVLTRVGADDAGLFIRHVRLARFGAAGSWDPSGLPIVLAIGESAHVQLDYGVRACPSAATAQLRVPASLASQEHGRVDVDLAALVPPHDWPRGLINVLCPITSR